MRERLTNYIKFLLVILVAGVPLAMWPHSNILSHLVKILTIYAILLLLIPLSLAKFFLTGKRLLKSSINLALLFFATVIALSTLFSVDIQTSLWGRPGRWEGTFAYLSYILIVFLALNEVADERQIKTLFSALLISASLISLYGVLQYFNLDPFLRNAEGSQLYGNRSFSTLGNPIFLGGYLCLLFPLSLSMYIFRNSTGERILFGGITSAVYACLIGTQSRGAWIGAGVALLFLFFLMRKKIKSCWKNILLISLIFLAITWVMNSYKKEAIMGRAAHIVDYETGSGANRVFMWKNSLPLIVERPWLGSGPDTFDQVFPQEDYQKHFETEKIVDKAHNEYLQIAVTMGMLGLIAYLSVLLGFLQSARKLMRMRKSTFWNFLTFGLFSGWIGYLAQAVFSISVISVAPSFYFLMGLTIATRKVLENNRARALEKDLIEEEEKADKNWEVKKQYSIITS